MDRCRECLRDLQTVAPRRIVYITLQSVLPVARRDFHRRLLGRYCSSDCALNAINRGQPQTWTKTP